MGTTQFREENHDVLRDGLRAAVKTVALALLGEPTSRKGSEWRWRKKGSPAVDVGGSKAGRVRDFEALDFGDLFWLIQREIGGGFGDAIDWARKHLGVPEGFRPVAQPWTRAKAQKRAEVEALEACEAAWKKAYVARLWAEAKPLAYTAAERYLTETRRISLPHSGWPTCLRYHPGRGALVIAATDDAGEVRFIQLVTLDAEGRKREDNGGLTKRSFGEASGAVVRLPALDLVADNATRPLLLAEGVETGLSVWISSGLPTWIALGSLRKVTPPPGQNLVLCADDDPLHSPAAKGVNRAVSEWRVAGHGVALAFPWLERHCDKSDFNDLIQAKGTEAVCRQVALAITNLEAAASAPVTVSQVRGRAMLETGYGNWYEEAKRWVPPSKEDEESGVALIPPPVHAIRVTTGGGKSYWARLTALKAVREMRQAGDPGTVVIGVPRHNLGDEYVKEFQRMAEAHGVRVRIWRGREAPNPNQPGSLMCLDPAAIQDAQRVGADVQTSVCRRVTKGKKGSKPVEHRCPFSDKCGYQEARNATADIWIVAHELMYAKPPAALGEIRYLIVDESSWAAGLEGCGEHALTVSLDALRASVTIPDATALEVDRLNFVYRLVEATFQPLPNVPVRRADVVAAGITQETTRDGRLLTWRRKVEPALRPGMTPAERAEVLKAALENPTIMKLGRLFKDLEQLLDMPEDAASGHISLETKQTKAGPQRIVRQHGRRSIGKKWAVPTIIADANLNAALLRPYWPQIQVTAEIEIETPHMMVRQLADQDMGKTRLIADARCNNAEIERRRRRRREAGAAALREIRQFGGRRCLVVAQQAVEDAWKTELKLPGYVDLQHHNNIAGRDEWKSVPAIVVVGRTLPRVTDVEAMAGALTGEAVTPAGDRLPRVAVPQFLSDGTGRMIEADRHPDPIAEAIRWQTCEGELQQIIGRGRGVNRSAADPLSVLVLTNRPLSIPVKLVSWDSVAPSPADEMLAVGGLAYASPTDAARAYPELWKTAESAKKAFQRWREAHPERAPDPERAPEPALGYATYQRAGGGHRPAVVAFDPTVVADPEAVVAGTLDDLSQFAVTYMPPQVVEDCEAPADWAEFVEEPDTAADAAMAVLPPIIARATAPPPPLIH